METKIDPFRYFGPVCYSIYGNQNIAFQTLLLFLFLLPMPFPYACSLRTLWRREQRAVTINNILQHRTTKLKSLASHSVRVSTLI